MLKMLKDRYLELRHIRNAAVHILITGGAVAILGPEGFIVPIVIEICQAVKDQNLDLKDACFDLGEHFLGGLAALIIF